MSTFDEQRYVEPGSVYFQFQAREALERRAIAVMRALKVGALQRERREMP